MKKKTQARDFYASWPDEATACMDYLHGHVIDNEVRAACDYEYARESKVLREAARVRDELIRQSEWGEIDFGDKRVQHPDAVWTKVVREASKTTNGPLWFAYQPWRAFLQCSSYPRLAWNQLTGDERRMILSKAYPRTEIQPLFMNSIVMLDAMGILDKLKTKAAKGEALFEEFPDVKPLIDSGQWVHALFSLDFSKSKKRLRQEFEAWLDLPENKAKLNDWRVDPRGTTDSSKEHLKYLASWRLYDDLPGDGTNKFDRLREFTDDNRKKDKTGRFLAFYETREGQSDKLSRNKAPLYRDPASLRRAISKARDCLVKITRSSKNAYPDEVAKRYDKWMKGRKISKSSC